MLSSDENSTAFAHSSIGVGPEEYISADEFRRIVIAGLEFGPTNILTKQCEQVPAISPFLHALSCGPN